MANGGVIAPVGLNMVALAAQKHAVPFVVLAGTHKVNWQNILYLPHICHVQGNKNSYDLQHLMSAYDLFPCSVKSGNRVQFHCQPMGGEEFELYLLNIQT